MLCLLAFISFAQQPEPEFDGKNWVAPYSLAMPAGWDIERFQIPIIFALQIPYSGIEDIRFMPGWANVKSDEYWTYAFLWYLNDQPEMNAQIIEDNLEFYYTGLIESNTEGRKIPADKMFPVRASIKKVNTGKGDLKTFGGTVYMLDYMLQLPITLNAIIHIKPSCSKENKTFVFYEISPKPLTDPVWQSLNQLWTTFDCNKK